MKDVALSLYHYRAVVVSVYDGDTITVDLDLGLNSWLVNQKLRLYGVDTPELRGAERARGLAVRDQVRAWLPVGSVVIVETIKDKSGKFGRWLAVVWTDSAGDSINQRLLDAGMAEEYLP